LRRLIFAISALAFLPGAVSEFGTAYGTVDPNLPVTIIRTNQSIILKWFGSNAVAYQVESSTALIGWTNSSLVLTGGSAFLFVTNPIVGDREFFRVKRLPRPRSFQLLLIRAQAS